MHDDNRVHTRSWEIAGSGFFPWSNWMERMKLRMLVAKMSEWMHSHSQSMLSNTLAMDELIRLYANFPVRTPYILFTYTYLFTSLNKKYQGN